MPEQSRVAKGFRERKKKVKAHKAMRERSNMPPALPPAAGRFKMPTFGCRGVEKHSLTICTYALNAVNV